jgi:hypothetical protein
MRTNFGNVKRYIGLVMAIMLLAALFVGCAKPASSPDASATPSASATTPIATTPPDVVETAPAVDEDEDSFVIDGWTYYLNDEDTAVLNYGEDPPLHRKNGTNDENLGIRGFHFDIIGDYIYVNSNYPDLDEDGNQTWYTTRMGLDGSGARRLEYTSMSERLIPEGEQKFYFTTEGESAVFVSDFSCETVTPMIVTLPDKSELDKKLSPDKDMQLDIDGISDGYITLVVTFLTPEGIQMYKGTYKMAEDGSKIEKVNGTYYDYESLESELD